MIQLSGKTQKMTQREFDTRVLIGPSIRRSDLPDVELELTISCSTSQISQERLMLSFQKYQLPGISRCRHRSSKLLQHGDSNTAARTGPGPPVVIIHMHCSRYCQLHSPTHSLLSLVHSYKGGTTKPRNIEERGCGSCCCRGLCCCSSSPAAPAGALSHQLDSSAPP